MRTMLWITRSESCAFSGMQQEAMQGWLRERGWQITPLPHRHRLLWRQRRSQEALVWTFVPSQLEVWLAKRLARLQVGYLHELDASVERLPQLDHWVTPSRALRAAIAGRGVAPNSITVASVAPPAGPVRTVDVRREMGLEPGTPLIYAAGPLVAAAGNRIAVWALNILNYLHPQARLILHGEGSEQERLEQFAHSIDGSGRVHFAPAAWAMPDLVAQSDQVWLPRQTDGVPDALLLALQWGKAIVAARQPSLEEWLRDGHNSLLVRHDQPAEWAAAGNRLLNDPLMRKALAQAAARTAIAEPGDLKVLDVRPQRRALAAA